MRKTRATVLIVLAVVCVLGGLGNIGQDTGAVLFGLVLGVLFALAARADLRKRSDAPVPVAPTAPGPAVAAGPPTWTPPTPAQQATLAIWRDLRPDALGPAPHERYAAWAQAIGEHVELQLLQCAPTTTPVDQTHPSPLRRRTVSIIDPTSVEDAATAMESLREEATRREEQARVAQAEAASAAEQREYEAALREVDEAAAAYQQAKEKAMLQEVAAEEAQERRAQAEAVAEALRKP